MTSKMR